MIISPYNLILDESIFVKVIATNYYGDSDYSVSGNGALTKLIPDAPINLVRDIATNAYTIAFTWDEGASDGGEVVIDHDIYYDQALGGDFVLLEEAVTILYYQTSVSLIPDLVYSFKITARNSVGDSLYSDVVAIRAARVPDVPLSLSNVPSVTSAYKVGLSWLEGSYNGGSAVLDYQVLYKEQSASVYTIFETNQVSTSTTVTGLTPATTYSFVVEARNVIGLSGYSTSIDVLAAQIPDEPTVLANVPANTFAN